MSIAKIGIDTGVNTGIAVWQDGKLQSVESMTITKAMRYILTCHPHKYTKLYIEDARLWVGFHGKTKQSEAKRQGAGSVKRDAKIWKIGAKSMTMRWYSLSQRVRALSSLQRILNVSQVGRVEQMSMQGMQP